MAILPGFGGGYSVSASDFIEGTSVKMKLLVSTIVGSVLITWWSALVALIENVGAAGRSIAIGVIEGQTAVLEAALAIPGGLYDTAYQAAADFMALLAPLGPFAFVVAAAITAVALVITNWAIRNAEVL